MTEHEFIDAIADSFASYCDEPREEWRGYAEEVYWQFLESEGKILFNDPNYEWTKTSAYDIAMDDVSYWKHS